MYEKTNPAHPDKVADRIAGAMVDLAYSREENPRVAVEVLLGHGYAYIIAESSVAFSHEDVEPIVERIVGKPLVVRLLSIPQDKHLAHNQEGAVRCGDNGIFKGCAPTHEQRLLTKLASVIYADYPYDGKYIIYNDGVEGALHMTVCQSHLPLNKNKIIEQWLWGPYGIRNVTINPLGEWTGGPDVDCGATNRKLGSDMGDGVTGGGLHGKDLSKADVSVNIACFLKARESGQTVTACCSIGDESVVFQYADGRTSRESYRSIVHHAHQYIQSLGGFERFAEWGLIRPEE